MFSAFYSKLVEKFGLIMIMNEAYEAERIKN